MIVVEKINWINTNVELNMFALLQKHVNASQNLFEFKAGFDADAKHNSDFNYKCMRFNCRVSPEGQYLQIRTLSDRLVALVKSVNQAKA